MHSNPGDSADNRGFKATSPKPQRKAERQPASRDTHSPLSPLQCKNAAFCLCQQDLCRGWFHIACGRKAENVKTKTKNHNSKPKTARVRATRHIVASAAAHRATPHMVRPRGLPGGCCDRAPDRMLGRVPAFGLRLCTLRFASCILGRVSSPVRPAAALRRHRSRASMEFVGSRESFWMPAFAGMTESRPARLNV